MQKKCLIISGGDFSDRLPEDNYELVIAVDKGFEYAEQLGLVPDIVIGDLDSLEKADRRADDTGTYTGRKGLSELELETEAIFSAGSKTGNPVPVMKLHKRKDDPDTLAAVRYALSQNYMDLTLLCIMGGRFDHMLSNLQIAAFAAEKGSFVRMTGDRDDIFVFRNSSLTLQKRTGWSLSVFSLSDICRNVTIKGTLYPAQNITFKNSCPIGLSNEWTDETAVFSVEDGILAVVVSKMP